MPAVPKTRKPMPTTTAMAAVTASVAEAKTVATMVTRPTVTPEPDRKAARVRRSGRTVPRHSWKVVMSAPSSRMRPIESRVTLEPPRGSKRKSSPRMTAATPSAATIVHDVRELHGDPRSMRSSVKAVARATPA